ncbi:aminopeptidase P family protein [Vibrio ziniensis]|uniref:Xaa-Pro aminopeptidase n=1 Tax=Vibrio ziniensis TaxID=2711221 RepID=A0A6G7CQ72_9VIBR|nr:aminopeptidase P family protein [Vibrio ziniensis]QIH44301.1 Xaa-Pro aminopeptidase [Vibrio ziniensis]
MQIRNNTFQLETVEQPTIFHDVKTTLLSDETIQSRAKKLTELMKAESLDVLVIYADKEHGSNFEYLSGFIPRFEEALMILKHTGEITYIMGNENLKLVPHARLSGKCLHAPVFSLPNQPMDGDAPLSETLVAAGIQPNHNVGIVGWKLFTGTHISKQTQFDIPYFVVEAVKEIVPNTQIFNATHLYIAPGIGARTINNANEIAHYEYGANLASSAVLTALNAIELGKSEKEIGAQLSLSGQPNSVIQIAATGDRFDHAQLYPRDKIISLGDKFSLTTGFKGGLSSRSAYVVNNEKELPQQVCDYVEKVATPYYNAVIHWLENMQLGVCGKDIYQLIDTVLPRSEYHWHLNPGHFVADEEWLSSPMSPTSDVDLCSGMMLQIDIIPSIAGYAGASIEDTIGLADHELQQQIHQEYPDLWSRIECRRNYIRDVLNINLPECVLPLSNTVGYLRPYLLNKSKALIRQK